MQRVAEGRTPGVQRRHGDPGGGLVEQGRDHFRQAVGDGDLLAQTDDEERGPGGKIKGPVALFPALELGNEIGMVDDGSGDQLGEKGDKQAVVSKAAVADLTPAGVHQVGDDLKGEK